jgi:uncharacterized protein (DUF58 family)
VTETAVARGIGREHQAEQLASVLPPLLVAAERVASAVAQGVHGRRRVGQGETFWQFRPYAQSDAASRIDWRASAKSARLYVRETEWEAAQSLYLWRDGSRSMDFQSSPTLPTKRHRAEILLLALGSLLLRGGERVTVLGSGQVPGNGRAVLARMAIGLDASGTGLPAFETLPRAAQLVLFGDFLAALPDIAALVARFAHRGLSGHMLQILDPAEEAFPFSGRVRFEGLEGEASMLMSRAEIVREAYIEKLAGHRAGLAAIARAARWSFGIHRTDQPPQMALLGLFNALAAPRGF